VGVSRLKSSVVGKFLEVCKELSESCSNVRLEDKSIMIYNPLEYAWAPFSEYVRTCLTPSSKNLLLGMNPGPFGMAQSGVPFGDTVLVSEFIDINMPVSKPKKEHPKRPIDGFECKRREVSGTRLWGWARESFKNKDNFFKDYFVWNYCPLVFMEESGANKTPDKLSPVEREEIFSYCDKALSSLIDLGEFRTLIGVGKFARKRLERLASSEHIVGDILHPSPASPKANKDWTGEVTKSLIALGAPINSA